MLDTAAPTQTRLQVIDDRDQVRATPVGSVQAAPFGYQPPLDGIRAVAVVAVVAYHAGAANGLDVLARASTGGFLGVSAFFTLSGFLITTLLLEEHHDTGRVSLRGFYSRRVRRLLPASLVTLGLVVVITPLLGTAGQLRSLPAEVWSSLANASNWRFIVAGNDYADTFAQAPSPLRHFWSLAVEEQWYLVMPVLVAVCLRVGRGRRRLLGFVLTLLTAGSFVAMLRLGHGGYSNRVYLGTDTRLAEIAIGAMAAVGLWRRERVRSRAAKVGLVIVGPVLLGIGLGVWSTTELRDGWLFRGGLALHAVATVMVIWSALQPETPLRSVLSLPPLVWLGRISYGVYLIHWPVLWWLTPDRLGVGPAAALAVQVAVTIAGATTLYFVVERPIRARRFIVGSRRWMLPIGMIGLVAASAAALPAPDRTRLSALDEVRDLVIATTIAPDPAAVGAPTVTAPPAPRRVMVVGDSFAMSIVPGLQNWGERTGLASVLNRTIVGCGFSRGGMNRGIGLERPWPEDCVARDSSAAEALASFDPEVVVVAGGMWDVTDRRLDGDQAWRTIGDPAYDAYLTSEILAFADLLGSRGARIIWATAPHWHPVYYRHMYMGPPPYEEAIPARTDAFNALLSSALAARPDVRLVDVAGWLATAPGGEFAPAVRIDGVHLTAEASDRAAEWLGPQVLEAAP